MQQKNKLDVGLFKRMCLLESVEAQGGNGAVSTVALTLDGAGGPGSVGQQWHYKRRLSGGRCE